MLRLAALAIVFAATARADPVGVFSWADAQSAMQQCTKASAFAPSDKLTVWDTPKHPLGNALTGWAAAFLHALATGRQLAANGPPRRGTPRREPIALPRRASRQ